MQQSHHSRQTNIPTTKAHTQTHTYSRTQQQTCACVALGSVASANRKYAAARFATHATDLASSATAAEYAPIAPCTSPPRNSASPFSFRNTACCSPANLSASERASTVGAGVGPEAAAAAAAVSALPPAPNRELRAGPGPPRVVGVNWAGEKEGAGAGVNGRVSHGVQIKGRCRGDVVTFWLQNTKAVCCRR